VTRGRPRPDSCSLTAQTAGVRAWGTAAQAMFWLAVEQNGPWGEDAATQSHLPPRLGELLDEECTRRGGRLALLRRPGRHPDAGPHGERTVYLAWAGEGPWLVRAAVTDPERQRTVDLDALARGDREALLATLSGAEDAEPVLLVCTHGRRDVCCAVRGRPVALGVSASHPGRVWEVSHIGGHRFSPTAVVLPFGSTLARLDDRLCGLALEAADRGRMAPEVMGPLHDRGRSALAPAAQAAECLVRGMTGETSLTALTVETLGEAHVVRHADGRSWALHMERAARPLPAEARPGQRPGGEGPTGLCLPESCGSQPVPTLDWVGHLLGGPSGR
jgi:hypothetical protein